MYTKVIIITCKWFQVCPMKRYYENGQLDNHWIENFCKGNYKKCVRYKMEEKMQFHPDWMLPDGTLDEFLKDE